MNDLTVNKTDTGASETANGSNARTGLFYLLAGGSIGAAVALLFAPKPGAILRADFMHRAQEGYIGAADAVKAGTDSILKNVPLLARNLDTPVSPKVDNILDLQRAKNKTVAKTAPRRANPRHINGGRRPAAIL